jgi:hypothetical protein
MALSQAVDTPPPVGHGWGCSAVGRDNRGLPSLIRPQRVTLSIEPVAWRILQQCRTWLLELHPPARHGQMAGREAVVIPLWC